MKILSRHWTSTYLSLLLLASCTAIVGRGETHYWMNFPKEADGRWAIYLPASVEKHAYEDAQTAVDLQEVVCDGISLKPEIATIAGGSNTVSLAVPRGVVMYQFDQNFFHTWIEVTEKTAQFGQARRFRIPRKAKVVEIKYRVRSPDGTISELLTATFVENNTTEPGRIYFPDKK